MEQFNKLVNIEKHNILKDRILLSIETTKVELEELKGLTQSISLQNAIGSISRMSAVNNRNH